MADAQNGARNADAPQYLNAYFPAYEGDWSTWAHGWSATVSGTAALEECASQGFWTSGFCMGQGQPPPGAYWNYSSQLQTARTAASPFAAMPWSLGNTHFDMNCNTLSLADRDAAIQQILGLIGSGLPVQLGLPAFSSAVTDSAGHSESLLHDMTWFLPPELAGCTAAQLSTAFNPNGGHVVNIIGYELIGEASAPDLYRSYFIIDNNWGKGSGEGGYYAMNFAAFKFLANALYSFNLVCSFDSVACGGATGK